MVLNNFKMNLVEDWFSLIKVELKNNGYKIQDDNDNHGLALRFLALKRRFISPGKRKIYKSASFIVPENRRLGLEILFQKIENGNDIRPYLSRKIGSHGWRQHEVDHLLNHWGIYHFHLGKNIESDGFIERTPELLFAYIDINSFYAIKIEDHNSFSNQNLINLIYENWPFLLKDKKLSGLLRKDGNHVSDIDIHKFRKLHIYKMMSFKNDNSLYMPLGGVCMYSGDSQLDLQELMNICYRLGKLAHDYVKENISYLIDEIKKYHKNEITNLSFKLCLFDDIIHVLEENSDVVFNLKIPLYTSSILRDYYL